MAHKTRILPTDEEWEELGHVWWSKWHWCPMPTSAVYAQLAKDVPGFEYPELTQWGGHVRFGQDLRSRWLGYPVLGPFKLHQIRHGADPKWSLYPRSRAFPVHIEYVNRFMESLTPESYEAVMDAALQLSLSGELVTVSNTALGPSLSEDIGFELEGKLLDRWTPQPRLIHDADWKRPRVLQADIHRDIALNARRKWKQEDTRRSCRCGCGGEVQPREFLPGHNTRHQANLQVRASMGNPFAAEELLGRGWVSLDQYRAMVIGSEVLRETLERKPLLEAERRNRSEARRKAKRS